MLAPFLGSADYYPLPHEIISKTALALEGDRLDKPMYTGRFFMVFNNKKPDYKAAIKSFENYVGVKVASSADFVFETYSEEKISDADVFLYNELGIALISASGPKMEQLQSSMDEEVIMEPELVVYAIPPLAATEENVLAATATWGLDITGVNKTPFTGRNIGVAVLDTGFDFTHPDFAGRAVVSKSFVPGLLSAQDGVGHGTHCIGTACGNVDTAGVRYGVANNSNIYAGKVLDNTGRGAQGWIINGIDWAANAGCKVISMSLGSKVLPGMGHSLAYEASAANAVSKGAVIVAAAGNDSIRKSGVFSPVSSPANCPSIVAVGAVGKKIGSGPNTIANLDVADFSNRGINLQQEVDIAAPGINVYSSWPLPLKYKTISGTSMATPHSAGILALLWEKHPAYTPAQIINEMRNLAKHLPFASIDVGAGLVNI